MSELFGIVAVFETPDALRRAASDVRKCGFCAVEAYTPYPVKGLPSPVRNRAATALPLTMFIGALLGGAWGYWIQYWDEALNYPLNVGGRPHNSWPAFIVSAFEFMLLAAVFAGFVGMLVASGLPKLYHPIFEANSFARASRDRFVLCIKASDPKFEPNLVRALFERNGAEQVEEVRP